MKKILACHLILLTLTILIVGICRLLDVPRDLWGLVVTLAFASLLIIWIAVSDDQR